MLLTRTSHRPAAGSRGEGAFVDRLRHGLSRALPTVDRRAFLRRSGLGLGVGLAATQLTLVQRARLQKSGLLPLLSGVFISQEMGLQKPDKAYYSYIMEAFGDRAQDRYLMIGDSLSADISGGVNAGIDTCWFRPAGMEPRADIVPTYTVRGYDELLALLLP